MLKMTADELLEYSFRRWIEQERMASMRWDGLSFQEKDALIDWHWRTFKAELDANTKSLPSDNLGLESTE